MRGDGYPVVELVRALENGNTKDLSRVPNLVYKKNGRIVYNQQTSQIIDIAPDFGLVKDYYRLTLNRLIRIPLLVNGSRGCHFDCTFCAIKEVYRDVKKRRPSEIIEDIKSQISNEHFLSRFFPRVMWITDDNFFSDREWAKEVLRNLATIKTKYVLVLQARVELGYDDEMLDLLRKANIGRVYIGIESLRDESLHNIKKGIRVEDIKDSIKNIKKYGIEVHGLFVFGDDEFRKGDWLEVANFVKEYGLSGLLIQPLTPFPGTKLFKKLKREGRILHENWSEYNGKVVFKPRRLTAAELQEEIYRCYNAVYGFSHVFKYMFRGRKGLRLGLLGEAIIRRREWIRMRRYIKERLMEKNAVPLL
ncbi:MAG: hypothetical protein DRH12_17475 [Deltaproteobacteria bacterium]|nr:MAG: hypothetical protein DRH12_17475 [Deltaproteobacteria bacterium]